MPETLYLRCRNRVMTYMDPDTHFKIPRGRVVRFEGKLTKTMRHWIRRGGLKVVDQSLFEKQNQSLEPTKVKSENILPEKEETPTENDSQSEISEPQTKSKRSKRAKKKTKKED